MTLIGAANDHGIEFIYAISPGLDITFSNQKEVSALKRKLDQVLQHFYEEHIKILLDGYLQQFSVFYYVISSLSGFTLWLQVLCLTF